MPIWRIQIGGSNVPVAAGSLRIENNIDERCLAMFQVIDLVGTAEYLKGQTIEIFDSSDTSIWTGFIDIPKRRALEGDNPFQFIWQIIGVDNWYLADTKQSIWGPIFSSSGGRSPRPTTRQGRRRALPKS